MHSIRILMDAILDYAGLFPPANLDMESTVRNYAAYRSCAERWMLSRLIVPVKRLKEFEEHAIGLLPVSKDPMSDDCWCISALTAPAGEEEFKSDLATIEAFNENHAMPGSGAALIDTIECRATDSVAIDAALDLIPESIFPYFELDHHTDVRGMVAAIAGMDAGAKIRTGGVTPDLHPTSEELARFILACTGAEIPFKATAGLHHPLLNYSEDVGCDQFGFLNVVIGACIAWMSELDERTLLSILQARSIEEFHMEETSLGFGDLVLSLNQVEEARERFCHGFGSCDFVEPLDDLIALNLFQRDSAQA